MKAYHVLNQLLKLKPNATPPTVYRALDFFVSHGILHKIESIQSYALCCEPSMEFMSDILIVCDSCHQVFETFDKNIHNLFRQFAETHQFKLTPSPIELKAICNGCA